jgi:hypothetical protein
MHRSLRFIRFDGTRYPAEMGKPEIERLCVTKVSGTNG